MWMTIVDLFLWLVIYSVTGWAYESTLCSVQERRLVNRGFLNGPLCPVYGVGAIVVLGGVGWLQGHPHWLFLAGMLLTCTVEYLTAWLLETLFDTKWWDYSHMRFNLHGRICLLGALVFGLFSVVLVQWLHPWIASLTGRVAPVTRAILAGVLFAAIAADTAVTVVHILRMNGRLREIEEAVDKFADRASERTVEWRNRLAAGVRAALAERFTESEFFSERIRSLFDMQRFQSRRLSRAFPRMHHRRYGRAWMELKQDLQTGKNIHGNQKKKV